MNSQTQFQRGMSGWALLLAACFTGCGGGMGQEVVPLSNTDAVGAPLAVRETSQPSMSLLETGPHNTALASGEPGAVSEEVAGVWVRGQTGADPDSGATEQPVSAEAAADASAQSATATKHGL